MSSALVYSQVYNPSVTAADSQLITAISKYLIIGSVTFLIALFYRGKM